MNPHGGLLVVERLGGFSRPVGLGAVFAGECGLSLRYFHLVIRRLCGLISERRCSLAAASFNDDDLKRARPYQISCAQSRKKNERADHGLRALLPLFLKWQSTRLIPHESDLRDKTIGQSLPGDSSSIHAPQLGALQLYSTHCCCGTGSRNALACSHKRIFTKCFRPLVVVLSPSSEDG